MPKTQDNTKLIYLEYLRIIAIIFVIFNHTGIEGFMLFSTKYPSNPIFWPELFLSIFCKFSVPIFFMISGLLLFKKEYTNKQIKAKILRMIITIIVFSFIYYLFSIKRDNTAFDLLEFFKKLLTCNISPHFWYLYTYIFFLLSYPILKLIINNINETIIKYLIVLTIIINGVIPIIYYLLFKEQFVLNIFVSPFWCIDAIVVYTSLGYYLGNKYEISSVKEIKKLWIINIVLLLISCIMTYYLLKVKKALVDDLSCQIFHNSFVIINAITIFTSIKYLFERININKKIIMISKLGKYVFGIYLIHPLIKKFPSYLFIHDYISNTYSSSILLLIVICSYMFIYSLIITFILSKIPYIRKLVGFK